MDPRLYIGRMLIFLGVLLVLSGILIVYFDRIPYIGRLPGDINYRGENWSFHFPIVTSLLLSLVLTILLNLFFRR